MAYRDEDQDEAASRHLRVLLALDDQVRPNLMQAIERAVNLGIVKAFEVVDRALPDDKDAAFDETTGILSIRTSEAIALRNNRPRARFTAAHELGHAYFRHQGTRYRSSSGSAPKVLPSAVQRDETQANYFAAAFLAPQHLLPSDPHKMTAAEIASHFQISFSAAALRKPVLERLYRKEHGLERALPPVVIDYLENARDRGHEVRSLPPSTLTMRAKQVLPPTIDESCNVCGWPRLELFGTTKVRCPECRATYDRFQDGDPAAI